MQKIKRDDTVLITKGKDRGRTGQVRKVLLGTGKISKLGQPRPPRLIVTGINMVKRHMKPRGPQKPGGIVGRMGVKCATASAVTRTRIRTEQMPPRLKERYREEIVPALVKEFGYANAMQAPRVEKVTLNVGTGEAVQNAKALDAASTDIATITGQHPVITRAKKSIANFKLREGMPIGVMVTLRGDHMWEFLDRTLNAALPRIRDFQGVSPNSFDGRGNYSLGIREQVIFPEIEYDKIDKIRGMQITICTTAKTDAPKFPGRLRNRCRLCGRPRAYIRKFGLCRICFRKFALEGHIPGVQKSSW